MKNKTKKILGAVLCAILQFNVANTEAGGVTKYNSLSECALQAVHQQEDIDKLSVLADNAKGSIDKMYLHWSAMNYENAYDDYHINIGRFGEIRITCNELTEKKAHTWRRNSRAIGISMDCMLDAAYREGKTYWGPCPPTNAQIRTMALVIAVVAKHLEIDINKDTVMTHAEAAIIDNYGLGSGDPEVRWDMLYLIDPDTCKEVPGGELLRDMSRRIK